MQDYWAILSLRVQAAASKLSMEPFGFGVWSEAAVRSIEIVAVESYRLP